MLCSSRLAVGCWKATKARAPDWRPRKLPSCAVARPIVSWRRPLCFSTRATSSDFGDPERLTGEDYYPDSRYSYGSAGSGGSDSEGDTFSRSAGSLGDKLDAASQLSESVPSASVDQLEEDGGGDENSGARRGGGNGGDDNNGDGNADSSDSNDNNKKLSVSQKLTLAYAVLVGVGGAIGYAKSKSVKSLISGAVSTAVLYYVYTQLPTNPVFASSMGLGISALLLGVMGARFKKSGKLFPAGVVSFVSLIMTGGYIHGILRSSHA